MDIGVVDPWDEVHGPRISWQIRFVSSPINCWTANVAGANILTSGLVMLAPATFRFQRSLIASSLHQLQSSWDFTYECNLKLKTAAQTWHCELSTILVNFGYHNWLMNTFSFFFGKLLVHIRLLMGAQFGAGYPTLPSTNSLTFVESVDWHIRRPGCLTGFNEHKKQALWNVNNEKIKIVVDEKYNKPNFAWWVKVHNVFTQTKPACTP